MIFEESSYSEFTAILAKQRAIINNGRIAGLDVGKKKIGLAISDVSMTIANGREIHYREKFSKTMQWLLDICNDNQITALVIGIPLTMDGKHNMSSQSVRQFAWNCHKELTAHHQEYIRNIPIILWDERFSSKVTDDLMLQADLSRKRRAELTDKLAASYILQNFLDYMLGRSNN